jgi:ATP-dependent RNA helicase DeaD
MERQIMHLKAGVDIVVGTPGRVIDHLDRGTLKLDKIEFFILDEADEMLNMGFAEDVEAILQKASHPKRMLFFSATMPDRIMGLAKSYMRDYQIVNIKKQQLTTPLTDQIYFEVSRSDKFEALCRIIDFEHDFYGIVFCRTKSDVDEVVHKLNDRGYDADGLHGDISQSLREKILDKFKKKKITLLVATDVAARGIDVNNLTHVINYSLPEDPEAYVHRIGRTGRAGKEGTAISFVTSAEMRKLYFIEKIAKSKIRREKLPAVKDIIDSKRKKIKSEVLNIITENKFGNYLPIAETMLADNEPSQVVAALLQQLFGDSLDEKSYQDLTTRERNNRFERDENSSGRGQRERGSAAIDKTGSSRLFIALGKKDGMTPRSLVEYIYQETKIEGRRINDVTVLDAYSFVTLSFEDAEKMIHTFKKGATEGLPSVERANDKRKKESGERERFSSGSSRIGDRDRKPKKSYSY